MKEPRRLARLLQAATEWMEAPAAKEFKLAAVLCGAVEDAQESEDMPTLVCLCGSTRFRKAFEDANRVETLAGHIVLSVGFFGAEEGLRPSDPRKLRLDELHKRKIDLADEVLVLNVNGYVGDSTKSEITYARAHGKLVRWLEPDKLWQD